MSEASLHVMTLNIRRPMGALSWRTADRWSTRKPRLKALITATRPHILATQEALPEQVDAVREALGSDYQFVGRGRSARGTGEGCPILFDTTRLALQSWHQEALSDTPHVAGSRSWGNITPRIAVFARFRDRHTGTEMLLINTHLDHLSARSRARSADRIRARALAAACPVIVTGDFNAKPTSSAAHHLYIDGTLRDAWHAARERTTPEFGTYANYRAPRPGHRIDWIAATPSVDVTRIGINAQQFAGGWPSDHLSVEALFTINDEHAAGPTTPSERAQ